MAEVILNSKNFEQEVLHSKIPVLVNFWATWCGPCKMMAPQISKLSEEHPEIKVCKLDVDQAQDIAAKYGIQAIPTLILFKDGEAKQTSVGFKPKEEIISEFNL